MTDYSSPKVVDTLIAFTLKREGTTAKELGIEGATDYHKALVFKKQISFEYMKSEFEDDYLIILDKAEQELNKMPKSLASDLIKLFRGKNSSILKYPYLSLLVSIWPSGKEEKKARIDKAFTKNTNIIIGGVGHGKTKANFPPPLATKISSHKFFRTLTQACGKEITNQFFIKSNAAVEKTTWMLFNAAGVQKNIDPWFKEADIYFEFAYRFDELQKV